jgi:hypothetical protein
MLSWNFQKKSMLLIPWVLIRGSCFPKEVHSYVYVLCFFWWEFLLILQDSDQIPPLPGCLLWCSPTFTLTSALWNALQNPP